MARGTLHAPNRGPVKLHCRNIRDVGSAAHGVEQNDEQYLHVLQSAKIIDIEDYSHGFSEKYRVHLEGGYVAAVRARVLRGVWL